MIILTQNDNYIDYMLNKKWKISGTEFLSANIIGTEI